MPNMMENSDPEIIERYLLYMRYAVMKMQDGDLHGVQDAMSDMREICAAHPTLTFPRVKLALTVIP